MTTTEMLEHWQRAGLFRGIEAEWQAKIRAELSELRLQPEQVLFHRGEPSDATYLIIEGSMQVLATKDGAERAIDVLRPGEPVGELQLLAGGRRTATVRACEPSLLVRLPRPTFESASADSPELVKEMAELIRRRLEHYRLKAVLPILFGDCAELAVTEVVRYASWVRLRRGEVLFRQGEQDQALCILMRGRLQAEVENVGERHVVGQVAPGECVGEMALFTGEERSATVRAARDSELIRLSPEAFKTVTSRHPEMIMEMTRLIIRRLRQSITRRPSIAGVTNIALLPTGALSAGEVAASLAPALYPHSVLRLSAGQVDEILETPGIARIAEDDPNAMRLEVWLDEQESRYEYILFEPDPTPTPWSWRCAWRADRILLLCNAEESPEPGALERTLLGGGNHTPAPRTMMLVHPEDTTLPSRTRDWLAAHPVEGCVHVRRGSARDFARLGRILTGNAVALVLSGGGAKGFAHIGVLRALEERGIPVDMIGGASMGSVIGACYAMGIGPRELTERSKRLFAKHRPFKEYTLPLVSVLRGHRLDRLLQEQFGEAQIEDLWTGYFCVTTDLTAAELRVHTSGPVKTAVRASSSIPGILPPMIQGDRLLVDGGVIDNMPVETMRRLCRGTLIAVDVAPEVDLEMGPGYATYPSPWQVIWNRVRHASREAHVPAIPQILFRTTILGSIHRANETKAAVDYYLHPDVERYGILQFDAVDQIEEEGYRAAMDGSATWTGLPSVADAAGKPPEPSLT